MLPNADAATLQYVERTAKFLLWARGGWKLFIGGPKVIGEFTRKTCAPTGARKSDCDLMDTACGIFDSQIAGGRCYGLATLGRRPANAAFFESHATDKTNRLIFGTDLTPLVQDEALDITEFGCGFIDQLKHDVRTKINKRLG